MQWSGKENSRLLTMHMLSPTPFSSDEGAESGDDSEEDLVTNYIANPPARDLGRPIQHPQQLPLHHRHQPSLQRQTQHAAPSLQYHSDVHSVQPIHTHGHGPPRRLVRMAEIPTMDSVTAESYGMSSQVPTIPTISITPHSPITQKPFTVLEESMRHLHGMQEDVQKMRDANAINKSGRALTRLSSSCPSLNVEGEELEDEDPPSCKSGGSNSGALHRGSLGAEDNSPSPTTPLTSGSLDDTYLCPDTPKIRVNDSTPTGSEEFLLDDRKIRPGMTLDQHRRRSWSGLSDEEKKRARQRSVSLSSLDSDTEEPFFDAEDVSNVQGSDSLDGTRRSNDKQRSLSGSSSPVTYKGGRKGGSSTHSLNEVHLDDKKVKRNTSEKPRLLTPRLTLQKSISTPSILIGVINQQLQKQEAHSGLEHSSSYYYSAQEQPDAQTAGRLPHHMLISHNVLPKKLSSDQYDDESVASKPRKRGSIFFRKKKDKSKKSSHQFVGVCYSNSATCDVCNKPMTNKPALRCETCLVCVHENTCKDQISDCSKLKNPKVAQKSSSSVSLSNATKSASLGSSPGSSFTSGFSASASRSKSSAAHSSSPTRPYSIAAPSKVTSEEKELLESHGDSTDANILDVNSASMESLEDAPEAAPDSTFDYIDSDPELRLLETEPELWVKTVDKELIMTLTEKQIKKQEYIYELIMTEKNHCRTLKVIKKLFAEGMIKELGLKEAFVKSIFPCLDELITIHFNFLWRLRERQRVNKYIETIGDLLLDQFSADNAQSLKDTYGIICAKQPDSIANFKELQKSDRRFQNFIKSRSFHPLLEKKEVTGRWVFTSQRCTKYPLGITEMIKYTRDNPDEKETLKTALNCIKDILRDINTQIHEKEMRQRLLEIYHKIDAKSSTMFRDQKFKKSDLLTDGRKLMFEGTATLTQQRGKQLVVVVVVMSDLLFFLHENNQKYYFVAPDSKAEAIPLSKLIVRENAGHDKVLYVITSGNHVEMYELECIHPTGKKAWLDSMREAVDQCPDDDLGLKRLSEGSADKAHELIMLMQHQDKELAKICEHKNKTVYELVSTMGGETSFLQSPDYRSLLDEHNLDHDSAKELQITSLNEALRLIGSSCGWATNLARSVSSVGEHQSEAYVSPSLPKRAETFGGFDNPIKDNQKQSVGKKKKDSKVSLLSTGTTNGNEAAESLKNRRPSGSSLTVKIPEDAISSHSSQSGDSTTTQQQTLGAHLIQCINTALVLSQHHLTQYEMLRAKISTGSSLEGRFSHSQKLEELRNIQEQISRERAQWNQERDNQEKWISDKKEELKKLQESLRSQQDDINQQREDLYRKLEALRNQGIQIDATMKVITTSHPLQQNPSDSTPSPGSNSVSPITISPKMSPTSGTGPAQKGKIDPPKHRHSTAALIKRDSNPTLVKPLKQQLPMKLAKLGAVGSSSSSSSSMSSSLSAGSFGGSPSQDRMDLPSRGAQTPPSGVQQMLPLKLCEATPKVAVGYQRLASPPDPSQYNRTGSSPANLQNGGATPSPGRQAHTYPKVPPRPPKPPSDLSRTSPGQRIKDPDTNEDIIFF